MNGSDNGIFIANCIADDFGRLNPLDCNMAAMLTAQILAEGKSKDELQNICHFLQLLNAAIKTYCNCR